MRDWSSRVLICIPADRTLTIEEYTHALRLEQICDAASSVSWAPNVTVRRGREKIERTLGQFRLNR